MVDVFCGLKHNRDLHRPVKCALCKREVGVYCAEAHVTFYTPQSRGCQHMPYSSGSVEMRAKEQKGVV